jgi:cytidylate kinase
MAHDVPLITVSRQFGSGGSAVAAAVAERLGWRLLDNAIVDAIAQEMQVSTETVRALDERQPPLLMRLADTLALDASAMLSPAEGDAVLSSDARIVEMTRRVMESAVAAGPVVVVGRGAQVVLGEHADALHVFCCAPREALVRRVAGREGLSPGQAERKVGDTNRQRSLTVRQHYERAWGVPETYHLCVNTEWLGIDGAAEVIRRAAVQKFGLGDG